MPSASGRVVVAANASWNIANYRGGLIRALKAHGYEPIVVAPNDAAGAAGLAKLDVEHIVVRVNRSGLNPFADLRLLLEYHRILKRLRPAAYLGFTIKPNIYGCLAARLTGVPAIANISGLGTTFITRGPLRFLAAGLYRRALSEAAVFFQNPDDRALFIERRLVDPDRTRLVPGSGIDLDHFVPSPLPQGAIVLLFIGRLLGDKGVRELAEAAARLRAGHPDVRIQMLGPIDEDNRTAISRGEVETWRDAVEYVGETDDVRPFIERATAIVLPSYREGLPRSLLEAGAMGRPLIATDVPGCREVVDDGGNGFLCEARDPESLAGCLKKFVELAPAQRAAMGAESRRIVAERFGEDLVIRAYLDQLGKLSDPRS